MNADKLTMLCREGDEEANDSLQRHFTPSCKVSKASSESCAVSAFSLVPGYNTFSLVQRTIVVHSCLECCPCLSLKRAPVGGRRFRPSVAVVSGCRFRPKFGTYEIHIFMFAVFFLFVQRSSGFTFGDNWRLSSGCTFGDFVTFSVIQLSVSLRVARCRALVPSGFIRLCAWLRESNFVHLWTLSVCVKTLHLGTVSICLALIFHYILSET